ncbi:UPF0271 protein [Auraticoccus monumenti]|uniref:UPF0271 protein n=1 Tax=Auraticoccus monumenti TaxID=675864 RepID=A0A1G6XVL1_9ACTN|nr:UPF0271 protein [Auraticoccus monumenti]
MRVDLNADVGESFGRWSLGDDDALMPLLTSANVACGFHAGDPLTMRRACRSAVAHGVSVGAHVGYRDLAGFGRRFVDAGVEELAADVVYQIGALDGIALSEGTQVRYVKPHGALYHATIEHREQASAVVSAIVDYDPGLAVVGWPGSQLLTLARHRGLRTVEEWFVDRGYDASGRLVPRGAPGALVTDPEVAAANAVRAVERGAGASLCVHSDSPGAAATLRAVRDALTDAGTEIVPFAA